MMTIYTSLEETKKGNGGDEYIDRKKPAKNARLRKKVALLEQLFMYLSQLLNSTARPEYQSVKLNRQGQHRGPSQNLNSHTGDKENPTVLCLTAPPKSGFRH